MGFPDTFRSEGDCAVLGVGEGRNEEKVSYANKNGSTPIVMFVDVKSSNILALSRLR